MKKYDWYLFDLDNTILDFDKTSKNAFFDTLDFFSIEKSQANYKIYHNINSAYWSSYEKKEINADELRTGRFRDFLQKIQVSIKEDVVSKKYLENLVNHSFEIEGARKVIENLSKTAQLAIITNGLSDVQHKRIAKHKLKSFFKHIFISDEMGVSKPNKEFFEIVYNKINMPKKNKVLVIGDNPYSDILGANNFGFDTMHYNYKQKDTEQLEVNYKINNWKAF